MQLSETLREYIKKRIAEIPDGSPGWLSNDGSALMVDGGIGYCCHVAPDGDAYTVEYEFDEATRSEQVARIDRSMRGQVTAIILGARTHPILAELQPPRTDDAASCEACSGKGFVAFEFGSVNTKPAFLCTQCCGLGWVSAAVFQ